MKVRTRSWLALGAGALCALRLASGCGGGSAPGGGTTPPAGDLHSDRRVGELLGNCSQNGFYDRDLADLVPVLIEKLERARPEALKRAKEELGALGARAFPALANFFHASYSDPMRSAYLENSVDALAFNATDESHELLLESLKHPQESVRGKALDGLAHLARPADFGLLVDRLAIETRDVKRQLVAALFQADLAGAEDLFLDLIARGEEHELWFSAAPRLASTERAETGRRCAELFAALEPVVGVNLAAAAARTGFAAGLDFLRAELRTEEVGRRLAAVSAVQRARLPGELEHSLLEDPSAEVRALAAATLGGSETLDERQRSWLRGALNDGSITVQGQALAALCAHDDDEGLARALAQLQGEPGLLQQALLALRGPLQRDRELDRRALELLMQRHALEEHRPVQQRTATFKAVGQLPLREAAEFLHRTGVAAQGEQIESLRAHDWLSIQAANTGLEGRGYLIEALESEDDPLRRIDLIDAIASNRDDLARTALLALVEGKARAPLERLFAASALIKIGPSWDVAPRLKRVCYAMQAPEEREARQALQCLLWQWY